MSLRLLFGGIVSIASIVLLTVLATTSVSAVKVSDFNPGRIIDDAVFYNATSMNTTQIQTFLNAKNPNCDTNGTQPASDKGRPDLTHAQWAAAQNNPTLWHKPPYVCLKNFKQNTPQVEAASGLCSALSARTNSSAAQIINDVSKACGINPQVLIILLEKEQSLVTDNWPINHQYQRATGFACPDNAGGACNPQYNGFFSQVYSAARQFKVYKAYPNNYNYIAKRTNNIFWQTNGGNFVSDGRAASRQNGQCGYSQVYIENQATAALYIYTPYRPNSAALNSYPGTGDACSAYGNRNFWFMFNNWFGSTLYTVGGGIKVKYDALGGVATIGLPTSNEIKTANGGVYQQFENGRIYWKDGIGASYVGGGVGVKYAALNYDKGTLGDPAGNEVVLSTGGVYQQFEKGRIYWKAGLGGGWMVFGGTGVKYIALGADTSTLGYPKSDEVALDSGGAYQQFENGRVYWTAGLGGGWAITEEVLEHYLANGKETLLGYPASDLKTTTSGNSYQVFQKATLSKTSSGIFITRGGVGVKYDATGGGKGSLGVATASESLLSTGGVYQQFENGRIYWKAGLGGGWVVRDAFLSFYNSNNADTGYIGYPTSDTNSLGNGNSYQSFQNATIHKTPNGVFSTHGGIGSKYNSMSGAQGYLGSPTNSEIMLSTGGVYQQFEKGRIYWKAGLGGGRAVIGGVGVKYISLGADTSPLGYPKGNEVVLSGGEVYQQFEHGRIYWKPKVGASVKYS